jgi:hypothetical protein
MASLNVNCGPRSTATNVWLMSPKSAAMTAPAGSGLAFGWRSALPGLESLKVPA